MPGTAGMLFSELASNEVPVDMIVQSARKLDDKTIDIIFTVASTDLHQAKFVLEQMKKQGKINKVMYDDNCAKVSIVGPEMLGTPGVAARIFGSLGKDNINIDIVSTSKNSISCLIPRTYINKAICAIHDEFFK